jgi:hypothetical protein
MASQSIIDISDYAYIVSHFDGNNNDRDDIAALPVAAMLINAAGVQGKSVFAFNNNLNEPNVGNQPNLMRQSAAFAQKLGIETLDYDADQDRVTERITEIFDSGKPVLSLEGGPMEMVYRALAQTSPENLKNITLVSHSTWNETRAVGQRPGGGTPRTWADIAADFPVVKLIEIVDQNGGDQGGPVGLYSGDWTWLDSTNDPVLQEGRALMKNVLGPQINDASDAGMHFFSLTGNQLGRPGDIKAFFEANPLTLATAPLEVPTAAPSELIQLDGLQPPSEPLPTPEPLPRPEAPLPPAPALRFEAETFSLLGEYRPEVINTASGQAVISLIGGETEGTGSAAFEFTGNSGLYNIRVAYYDENDGLGQLRLNQGNATLLDITMDQELGSVLAKPSTSVIRELSGVQVQAGDRFELFGVEDGLPTTAEHVRVDYLEFIPVPQPPRQTIRLEAESFILSGEYRSEAIDVASQGQVISLRGRETFGTGAAEFSFGGPAGLYNIKIGYFDENDGQARFTLDQGGQQLLDLTLDRELGSRFGDAQTLTSYNIEGVNVGAGDRFTLRGFEDGTVETAEHVRIDYLEFIPVTAQSANSLASMDAVLGSSIAIFEPLPASQLLGQEGILFAQDSLPKLS